MDNKKTSKKQKNSSKKFNFNQPELVREILADCILSGDMETFEDVILAFIRSQPKSKLAHQLQIGRQTLYDLMNEDKRFNPEWETLSGILRAMAKAA